MKENNIFEEDNLKANYKIKMNFFNSTIDLSINDDYNSFINNICNIIKISKEDMIGVFLSYIDNDGDTIILSCKVDYDIFLEQVTENSVDQLDLKIKENSKLNADECFANFIYYKEQIEGNNYNNNIKDNKNDNEIIVQDYNNNENIKKKDDYINDNKNDNDIIFEFECSSCNEYPILKILFYCPICDFYLCSKCEKNTINHIHPILKIETYEEFINIFHDNFEIDDKNEINKEKKKNNKYRDYIPKFIKDLSKSKLKKIAKKERKIKDQ